VIKRDQLVTANKLQTHDGGWTAASQFSISTLAGPDCLVLGQVSVCRLEYFNEYRNEIPQRVNSAAEKK